MMNDNLIAVLQELENDNLKLGLEIEEIENKIKAVGEAGTADIEAMKADLQAILASENYSLNYWELFNKIEKFEKKLLKDLGEKEAVNLNQVKLDLETVLIEKKKQLAENEEQIKAIEEK